ncbi:hypothetical protein DFA_00694 [Cavenderia fasciculata]|uniref:Uncharacterized protein n=1 Tax=Cavenderia fasciculata TaxID=261658 RepID=F4PT93_CACFS|nr:uncharacterized protein DFA_00694 [Cavenderia fasciculata]EGG20829.1 hypothetical protein DFA_00694 [Cavenderia fasciculata]|eukprot:XP_004358679.1 hypothetical protein DFA_00694 [Cavenderia fasciculata]
MYECPKCNEFDKLLTETITMKENYKKALHRQHVLEKDLLNKKDKEIKELPGSLEHLLVESNNKHRNHPIKDY